MRLDTRFCGFAIFRERHSFDISYHICIIRIHTRTYTYISIHIGTDRILRVRCTRCTRWKRSGFFVKMVETFLQKKKEKKKFLQIPIPPLCFQRWRIEKIREKKEKEHTYAVLRFNDESYCRFIVLHRPSHTLCRLYISRENS